MEFSIIKLRRSVQLLTELIETPNRISAHLRDFLEKKSYKSCDIEILLRLLSCSLLDESLTISIATAFEEYLLLLITNALEDNGTEIDAEYQIKAIALAKLMHLSLCVKRYGLLYFRDMPPPFSSTGYDTLPKKSKTKFCYKPDKAAIIKCCFYLLKSDTSFFKDLWNWSEFLLNYVDRSNSGNSILTLYTNHIIAMLTNMNTSAIHKLNKDIPEELLIEFYEEQKSLRLMNKSCSLQSNSEETVEEKIVVNLSAAKFVTNIEGVFLPIFNSENYENFHKVDHFNDDIIRVESTIRNLRSIALGVTSGRAICLSGPVGCGKTTLVEHLARMTGRFVFNSSEGEDELTSILNNQKNCTTESVCTQKTFNKRKMLVNDVKTITPENGFLRIQLGDQTDSKMLLGQYHCTDVPGEFIWLPGVLTQAVMNGYWLLLEDLDCATTDTFTVLSSLLENNYLTVPGFRDCVKITPGFQLFVTVRTHKSSSSKWSQKALFSLLEKHLYPINILPLSRNELCEVISRKYSKLATVANRMVDVFLTFSSGDHNLADNLRQQESKELSVASDLFTHLPFEEIKWSTITNSGRLVSTRDLIKLCQRSSPTFSVTSTECAYFVFQNAVDIFCSYLPNSKEKTKLIVEIGAKLGIIQSRCEHLADELKPEICVDRERIKVGRATLYKRAISSPEEENVVPTKGLLMENRSSKRIKLSNGCEKHVRNSSSKRFTSSETFSFTRLASCLLERIAVCVANAEPVLLVGETGVGKTSSVQYLASRTKHNLVVVNMNNQSDVSDLVGGFKPVDLAHLLAPMRTEFEMLFRSTFNQSKNESFLTKFSTCYNQGNFSVVVKLMIKIIANVIEKSGRNELREKDMLSVPRWLTLKTKLQKLHSQLSRAINISFAFIPGSLVKCLENGDWLLLDEINLASAETLECLSTILEPNGSIVLLEKGDFKPVQRHSDFRIFSCMNPNTDIGKKDLPVGIRNRFTEFFVDEAESDADLSLLVSDYLSATGIQRKSVMNIVKLYKRLKSLAKLELNDGLGNRPVYSLRTLCRALTICAKNLCGSIERNLYESFCLSFLTQLDSQSHNIVQHLIKEALLGNAKSVLSQTIPKPGENYLNFEGYWIERGFKKLQDCSNYILTNSVKENLKDLARIISIGKLPILLQGPTSAGKTSLIDYVARCSGNHCLRINNHEHTDLQEYIGSYTTDITGKMVFKEGILIQAMRCGYWIILDELNLASTEILEALNRVLDDNREIFIPETQTVVRAHANFMLFATQNPPGLYGGRKTLSRAFKNRFIELHFSDIPRGELEIILEKKCFIPASYARKMVACMVDLQKNRKSSSKNTFTLRDLFRWGVRYTLADKKLLEDAKYDWNQHLVEEGYLVLSAKVRNDIELEVIHETLYKNFRKQIALNRLFDINSEEKSLVTKDILDEILKFKSRTDIVWTRNMTRMAVLTAKALQFDEPVLLVGPTGCGKTTVCQLLATIRKVNLRILNCHMHTEGADFLGGLRPCRHSESNDQSNKIFEWADGPLVQAMQDGSYFMADEISLAEDSVLERLNCVLEPDRTVLLAEKCGIVSENEVSEGIADEFLIQARQGFQFLATMNPGGDFGKKELSPALRNRFTEIWCQPSTTRADLIEVANNCIMNQLEDVPANKTEILQVATYIVDIIFYIKNIFDKFKFSIRDILAMANYVVSNTGLSFAEKAIFGLETTFLDALEMSWHDTSEKLESLKRQIIDYAIHQADVTLGEKFSISDVRMGKDSKVEFTADKMFGIKPFYIKTNLERVSEGVQGTQYFLFDAPTTKQNLFRLLSALSLNKPILLEGPPGVGKTSIVESLAQSIGYNIVRINLCEHTDLADLFGTDLPAEDTISSLNKTDENNIENLQQIGSFQWRDGPLLAALKSHNSWILLDELNLAPQSVLEGLNAVLDHRGEVFIPELNKTFALNKTTRVFASQNPLKQGGGRKGLPQSFLNRFTKVYVKKLTCDDLLYVVDGKYKTAFDQLRDDFIHILPVEKRTGNNLFDIHRAMKQKRATIPENGLCENSPPTLDLSLRVVRFSELLDNGLSSMEFGYKGGPFEINLRDVLFWCNLLINPETGFAMKHVEFEKNFDNFLLTLYERMKLVYCQRMRTEQDKLFVRNAFETVFQCDSNYLNAISEDVSLYWTNEKIYLNDIALQRDAQPLHFQKPLECSPLLLESQRGILKNLIECVHIEKPVLLCGSTDTGKTKIVDSLCCISDQKCNLDNIDDSVTGSFQQIDLNRHLEDLSFKVECMYLKCIQIRVFDQLGTTEEVATLLNCWNSYSALRNYKCERQRKSFVSEELMNYRRRLEKLNDVIDLLLKHNENLSGRINQTEDLQLVRRRLNILSSHIKSTNSLNTGGCFEWVDSKIVKSLKDGEYILLEHVNLCSSAVLDRLNPVFEPNGSLMLSEKGVTNKAEAEIVHKGHNFRAFLTIDPKNGELSRAMRNRCVEIFLSNDALTLDDKRKIVFNQGVEDISAINSIINIHDNISMLSEINNLNLSHLTQAAFLCASYARIGFSTENAIYTSAMEVYVYPASVDVLGHGLEFYQNRLRGIVVCETNKHKNKTKGSSKNDYLKDAVVKCNSVTEITLVNLQILPLKIVMDHLLHPSGVQDALSAVFSDFATLNMEDTSLNELCKFLIYIIYENSSLKDLRLRYLLLKKCSKLNPILTELSEALYNCIANFNSMQEVNASLPWNTAMYPRLRDYKSENLHGYCLSSLLVVRTLLAPIPAQQVTKISNITALAYSQAVAKKALSDKLNNSFLRNLFEFLHSLQQLLQQHMDLARCNIDLHTNLITALQWFNRLLNESKSNLYLTKQLNTDMLDKLVLHFKWLDKNLMKIIDEIFSDTEAILPELTRSRQQLLNYANTTEHPLDMRRKMYAKHMLGFQPFSRMQQVHDLKAVHELDKLLRVVPLYGELTAEDVTKKLTARKSELTRKAYSIVSKSYNAIDFTQMKDFVTLSRRHEHIVPKELASKLHTFLSGLEESANNAGQMSSNSEMNILQHELTKLQDIISNSSASEIASGNSLNVPHEVEVMQAAVREYFLIKGILAKIENSSKVKELNLNSIEYQTGIFLLNGTTISLLNTCQLPYYEKYCEFWFHLCDYIYAHNSIEEFKEVILYLNGGYKHMNALNILISNSVQKMQLERLNFQHCKDTAGSQSSYAGPPLINILSNLLSQGEGNVFQPVPLRDLDIWKNSLNQLHEMLWHNSMLLTPTFSTQWNNYERALRNAKRLLVEVKYIEMSCAKEINRSASESHQCFYNLVSKLNDLVAKCDDERWKDSDPNTRHLILYKSSLMNALAGCIQLSLVPFTPLIDPVEKNRLKTKYVADDIRCLNNLKIAYDSLRIAMKYKHLGAELYDALHKNLVLLKEKHEKLKQRTALRPDQCLYSNLVKDITHFLTANCATDALLKLINNIESIWSASFGDNNFTSRNETVERCEELIDKLKLWIANSQRFVYHTLTPYSLYYQDFLQPLQCSVQELHFGFAGLQLALGQIKSCILDEDKESQINISVNNKLHTVLKNIVEFPSNATLSVFSVNLSPDILKNRCPVFSILKKTPGCESNYFRLLKAKVIELKNRLAISQCINQNLFREFDFAFNIINQLWQKEEELRRQKQKEDESLYLTKTKCEDEDEETTELREIEDAFPSGIRQDFGEFLHEETLEKIVKLDPKKQQNLKNVCAIVQESDYSFIARSFIDVFIRNSQTHYHSRATATDGTDQLYLVENFTQRLHVFARIYNEYKSSLNECFDEDCLNSLNFGIAIQKDTLADDLRPDLKQDKSYNFYKDSNIQEILPCIDVLNDIERRVKEQLELYTEHATLLDIQKIIERIRSLPTTAPVVRFNTGFQILRQHVSLWNEVAHKNNNLKAEEEELARLVKKWTGLELQFWRKCLALSREKIESIVYKYWFFIYNLIHEYIAERPIDVTLSEISLAVKRFEEQQVSEEIEFKNEKHAIETKDVINILRQFMESSSYGDFEIRLQLLLAFELYLHNFVNFTNFTTNENNDSASHARITDLLSGLRNLQLYFKQFSSEIEEHKRSIKMPIEKKLKELVKIESYNKDLSYISMRNNVARVHRNLHKFLKEYEQGLKEKITAVFQQRNCSKVEDYTFANCKGKDLRFETKMKYYMVSAKCFVLPAAEQKISIPEPIEHDDDDLGCISKTLLSRVHHLFNTSRNVVKATLNKMCYPKLIVAMDNLLIEQLERSEDLRKLTVDRTKDRSKQKAEAKQILQQKRKAVADLFKVLTTLGVNYKTGLLELSMADEFEDVLIPAFCIKTMLSNFKRQRLHLTLLQLSENLDMYFNRCIFKLKLLRNVMLTPLPELGPHNIERFKGFAIDLFLLVQKQRKLLAATTKNLNEYKTSLKHVSDLNDIFCKAPVDESYVRFSQFLEQSNVLKVVIARVRYVFEQLKLYFLRAPCSKRTENIFFIGNGDIGRETVDVTAVISDCEKIISLSKMALTNLNNESEFIAKDRINHYRDLFNQLDSVMQNVLKKLKTDSNGYLPVATPLLELSEFANAAVAESFKDIHNYSSVSSFENTDLELETIIHSVLFSLQKLYKKYSPAGQANEEDKLQAHHRQKNDAEELEDQHLKTKLFGGLKDDWSLMNMDDINKQLLNILLVIKLSEPSKKKILYIRKLLSIQPLLEQFNLMAEYFLYQQVGVHKVSVKMLSTILTVFIEIGTKGFCVPQDLLQDEDGDNRKDQKEGGGFGLEDGTGENDASDKIESEDQLDDAKRPEDRKNESDQNEPNDCKEEKGIEMSDNFDAEMQDIEKPDNEEDDSGESENEEDMSKEMGETEDGAEKLDDQIWGDDETSDQEDAKEMQDEENGKGNSEEQDSHNDINCNNEASKDNAGKDDLEKDGLDATNEPNNESDRNQKNNDITEDLDEEGDSDQVNPYHNDLEEPQEPEDFNLDDLNVNDDDDKDESQQHNDNPFDIDTMKENMKEAPDSQNEQEKMDDACSEQVDDVSDDSQDSDTNEEDDKGELNEVKDKSIEEEGVDDDNQENLNETDNQKRGQDNDENSVGKENENRDEKSEEYEQSKDQAMKEDNIQSLPDTESKGSNDQVENEKTEIEVEQDQKMDEQDTGKENEGIGQAQNEENDGGHQGIAETKEAAPSEANSETHSKEKRKQGQTDEDRATGNAEQNHIKRLKTINKLNEDESEQKDEEPINNDADEYQHVKEPKKDDKLSLDNATEEQSKLIRPQSEEEKSLENADEDDRPDESQSEINENCQDETENTDLQQMKPETFDKPSEKRSKLDQKSEKATTEHKFDVEGEIVETSTTSRSDETIALCNMDVITEKSGSADDSSATEMLELRRLYQDQAGAEKRQLICQNNDHENWSVISNRMSQNARDLCEQLRLILEPTKCTRLKGDYRTGRRINMKKIIPYIASQFRKDKIWLRRTKPAQRDYKITIAIDDSKSMHHNNSKSLTLQAISLVSQALTLLESGRLSVVSFGEKPQILLNHSEQFDGPRLVTSLQFVQDKTKIAELLDFVRIANSEEGPSASDNGIFENLLLILSDGRNIFGEGKAKVKNAIKLARLQRIFMVYIIIDNPENKDSILDVQTLEMLPNNSISIKSYLEDFPFPYYVIVRDLNQLPVVLSEAMRQWFELVNSEQ